MKEIIKIIVMWVLALISAAFLVNSIGRAWRYSDENTAKELQVCLDKGIIYQECYSGLNYYEFWNKSQTNK